MTDNTAYDAAARRGITEKCLIAADVDKTILSQATGKQYLVDAGPDIRPQLNMLTRIAGSPPAKVNRSPVDGVFLTHAHLGHYTGLAFFGFEAVLLQRVISPGD